MSRFTTPLILAVVVSLANAAKPAVVDDTAYLTFARHISAHPLDPYGFTIHWYTYPEPAMEVLCPPVVPYWLALGMRVFGESVPLLKLWMFPFVWLFAWSLRQLLRRFARGSEGVVLPLVVLSPAVLPMVNVMLDIPAAAFGLAALAVFPRSAAAAGLLAAFALQTKYTALVVPPLLAWYGLTTGRVKASVIAVVVAVAAFCAWEALNAARYGVSHFVFHLTGHSRVGGAWEFVYDKLSLFPPLAGHLGCLAAWVGFYAGGAVGVPRRWVRRAAAFWLVGAALMFLLPHRFTVVVPGKDEFHDKLTLAGVVWRTVGTGMLLTMLGALWVLVRRKRPGTLVPGPSQFRYSPLSLFVVGWVLLELAAYFALTPFPAARRLVGLSVALAVLAARVVRLTRVKPERWVAPAAVAFGLCVTAIDTLDAYPEKALAERAATFTSGKTWFAGHWGFQWYCGREGMKLLVPGESAPQPGDFLVIPAYPDAHRFYRPHIGNVSMTPPADRVEVVAELAWEDWLAAQTVPNFYGGIDPVEGRGAPRLRVVVYRVVRPWAVPEK
jgi:hypothetical protein